MSLNVWERWYYNDQLSCNGQLPWPSAYVLTICSPEMSPDLPPQDTSLFASPQSRANRLASIAEDDDALSLSQRREGAPQSIDLKTTQFDHAKRRSSVTFADDDESPSSLRIEEITPSTSKGDASPAPDSYRVEAGHTPLRAPQAPTSPPAGALATDGISDTPTRNNTDINNFLTESREDDDHALKGPLKLPELPSQPGNDNFTLDALNKRLEQIKQQPSEATPMVFKQPSPGLVSPVDDGFSPKTIPE